MKKRIDPLVQVCVIALTVATLQGCTPSPPPPPAVTGCGPLEVSVAGRSMDKDAKSGINATATLNDSGTSVDWMVTGPKQAETAAALALHGLAATGPIGEESPRKFTATGTSDAGDYILTVTGTITGPPSPCSGLGAWVLRTPDGAAAGRGRWRTN